MKSKNLLRLFVLLTCVLGFATSSFAISLLPLAPANSGFVMNFNLQKMLNQDGIREYVEGLFNIDTSKDFKNFYKQSGINPTKDIENILVFLTNDGKTGIIVNGAFDTSKITDIAKSEEGISDQITFEELNGFELLSNSKNANGNTLIVDKHTVAFGEIAVLDAITYLKGEKKKSIITNNEFAGLIKRMNLKSAFWGATVNTGKSTTNNPIINALENVNTSFFSINYNKSFIFNFTGKVSKPDQLPAFKNSLINIIDVFKGWCASSPEVVKVLKNAKVQAKGTLARIVLKIPAPEFKLLVEKLTKQAKK